MLTLAQSRELNRFMRLRNYLIDQSAVVTTYAPFMAEVSLFRNHLERLEGFITGKNEVSTGITTGKTALKHLFSQQAALVCTKTKAYALKHEKSALAAEMNYRANKIFKLKDADILGLAKRLEELITPLLNDEIFMEYLVTPDMVSRMVESAANFTKSIGKAGVTASVNTVANINIEAVIKSLQNNIRQFDLLVDHFRDDYPEFVEGYHISAGTEKTGIRHSGVTGIVTNADTGEPLANVFIKLADTTKTAHTDEGGHYSIIRVPPGSYTMEISADGFEALKHVHRIKRGRIETINFILKSLP